ncbi:MAG: alpha/beta hydrolase [Alphaproteobacteria bacterium]|nr:alpha/beta hydrolase [Alphaproteobacteria bacterium]
MPQQKLDPREEQFWIPGDPAGLQLFLRYLPPDRDRPAEGRVVLYVHGGTFPSALSIAHRFDGRSWRDELATAGFHVWGLDFHGFGRLSDPYPEMAEPAAAHGPLGRAEAASRQLEQAVRFVAAHHGVARVSIIAHSWGSIVAGRFAGRCPERVERLVFFGPIACRPRQTEPVRLPAWRLISLQDQWDRFVADVPRGEAPVLRERHFREWGEAYLDCDPESRSRVPPAVKVPSGAFQDIFDAWAGDLAYDPALIRAPVAIVRGEWDSFCTDADAGWLFTALRGSPVRRDVKISRATHLMHLEEGRFALYRETEAFLNGGDTAPPAAT